MKWQKVKLPVFIANHFFVEKLGQCRMCGASFRIMTSADPGGLALFWNGAGRIDDTNYGLPVDFHPAGKMLC